MVFESLFVVKKRGKVGDLLLGVEYSSHALARLKVRNIKGDEVERVLLSPQELYFDVVTGNLVAIGGRALGVIIG